MQTETTINKLPKRRGVVMRFNGIRDSYGTLYEREIGSNTLRRVGAKIRNIVAPLTLD